MDKTALQESRSKSPFLSREVRSCLFHPTSVVSGFSVAKVFCLLQICQAMQLVRYLQYPLGSVQVQHSRQYPRLYFWQMEKAFRFG
jgi:hypothetical protein